MAHLYTATVAYTDRKGETLRHVVDIYQPTAEAALAWVQRHIDWSHTVHSIKIDG